MKFGRNLPRNQVPEWATAYINYKGLKKLIKSAAEVSKDGKEADLAEFFFSLDRNLEDVDGFYNKKFGDASRRLKLLYDRYGRAAQMQDMLDKDEAEELIGALLEVRGQLRKLQWYGEVNRRGFIKITKKLDKKVPAANAQQRYLNTKVDPKPFATNNKLTLDLRAINDWLSTLSDLKTFDDSGSVTSTSSLRNGASRAVLNLPPGLLDLVEHGIRLDDNADLDRLLRVAETSEPGAETALQQLLINLLQRAISCKSKNCIAKLLPLIKSLDEEDDISKRNCLHRLVIAIGRNKGSGPQENAELSSEDVAHGPNFIIPATSPVFLPHPCTKTELDLNSDHSKNDAAILLFEYLLGNLQVGQRPALWACDSYGRTPLHYSAQYGIVAICHTLLKCMKDWSSSVGRQQEKLSTWKDLDGLTPLHLSVMGGHVATTEVLIAAEDGHEPSTEDQSLIPGEVLALAVSSNNVPIAEILLKAGVYSNFIDEQGETALHICARFGYTECADTIIKSATSNQVDVDVPEKTFGWTPLFIACVDGHLSVAELLISAGTDVERVDMSGWTAKEHAALRGHMNIASRLAEVTSGPDYLSPVFGPQPGSPTASASLEERRSNGIAKENTAIRTTEPVKSFGHRYLTKESMVLVSLGTMDLRKTLPAVKLDNIPLADAHATQLDTALSLVVSASGAKGEPTVVDLPIQENISTEPITFMTMDAGKIKLLFDIIPTYAGTKDKVVARGVALLSSVKPSVGSKKIPLQGDVSVPIVAASNLEVIGSVHFNFLIITPFTHPNMSISTDHTYWKSMASTMVIGHRGLGKNMAARRSLQLGENTIQSFISAANLGASYVEFDVQLTKDLVPVIYHDFLVSETGIDAPVHTLTLEQFMHVSEQKASRHAHMGSPRQRPTVREAHTQENGTRRIRSYSLGTTDETRDQELAERMKHTRDFKIKGFKGNSRGNFIQEPFTTLQEMFVKLPEHIGFNIEMKYPMLFESEEHEMDTYAVELNSFVDTVLTKVYDFGQNRNIIFSSFNPDICLMLSFKQPSIPVLFLTDAGTSPVGDIRASSLQEAIRFASRWNLLGVVSSAQPLVTCPRLVKVVKESGLVCVSYGVLNNQPENVKLQVREGIDAVIVDSVLAIRKGLTANEDSSAANGRPSTNVDPTAAVSST